MKTRTVKSLVGIVMMAVLACLGAGPALAGTLLSGYGGPGEGNQAILGAGLVNLPSGGGPGGAAGANGAPSGESLAQASSGSSTAAPGGQGTSVKSRGRRTGRPSRTSGSGPGGYRAAHTPSGAAEPVSGASAGSQPLGLSGSDMLFIVLALAALLITGLLTRQLTHGAGRRARG